MFECGTLAKKIRNSNIIRTLGFYIGPSLNAFCEMTAGQNDCEDIAKRDLPLTCNMVTSDGTWRRRQDPNKHTITMRKGGAGITKTAAWGKRESGRLVHNLEPNAGNPAFGS